MRKRTRREEVEKKEEEPFSFTEEDIMLPSKEKTRVLSDSHEDQQVPSTESLQTKNGGGGRMESSKDQASSEGPTSAEDCGRERLKRYRKEMAGRVWIPESWGQESLLKDWIDCAAFDGFLVPKGLTLAREALVAEGQRTSSGPRLGIENRC